MQSPLPPQCAAKFRAERLLASGGFGSVWLAVQETLDRKVAVKVLHGETLEDQDMVDRFLNEARITAALNHPNIVKIIDHGVDGVIPWIAYEFVPGRSLREIVKDGGLPWPEALRAVSQVAAALSEAHAHGILHRDIKPDNVLEASHGVYKVADFGIAKWHADGAVKTRLGVILGTPAYISPMQIAGQVPTAHSDLYALGILAFELLTGRAPFHDESVGDLLRMHRVQPVPRPSDLVPDIAPEADRIVLKMLSKMREERHQSALDLVQDLERALEKAPRTPPGIPVPGGPGKPPEEPIRPRSRPSGIPARPVGSSVTRPSIVPPPSSGQAVASPADPELRPLGKAVAVFISGLVLAGALAFSLRPGPALSPASPAPTGATAPASPPPPAPVIRAPDGAEMVLVQAGAMLRSGLPASAPGRPEQRQMQAFYMDRLEVTNQQWDAWCASTGKKVEARGDGVLVHPQYPAIRMTWHEAATYCRTYGKRLPTEVEWEYAARGSEPRRYPWGDELDPLSPQANYRDGSWRRDNARLGGVTELLNRAVEGDDHFPTTAPVGSFRAGASPWGILDLAGNVGEWCANEFPREGAASSPATIQRAVRGGSWDEPADRLTTTFRRGMNAGPPANRSVGFRAVISLSDHRERGFTGAP